MLPRWTGCDDGATTAERMLSQKTDWLYTPSIEVVGKNRFEVLAVNRVDT